MEELKFITLPGLELRPLCRLARSSSYTDCATALPMANTQRSITLPLVFQKINAGHVIAV
jgi:hypothetical protein